jgi:hypothetical protein
MQVQGVTAFDDPHSCFSVVAADFDNDMDLDLYLVCSAPAQNLPNIYFENTGDGSWRKIMHESGALGSGDSVVTADYDQDGFVDLLVTNGRGEYEGPVQLFRNRGNGNHWIGLDLQGTDSNRDAIGAKVTVIAGGQTQNRMQAGGMHRYAQNFKRMHVGLGEHAWTDDIVIRWPSGRVQHLGRVKSDQILSVSEPQS